jgi:hypothetical protein
MEFYRANLTCTFIMTQLCLQAYFMLKKPNHQDVYYSKQSHLWNSSLYYHIYSYVSLSVLSQIILFQILPFRSFQVKK